MSRENGFMDMIRKNPVTTGLISFAVLALLIIVIVMTAKKNNTPKPTTKEGFSLSDTFTLSNMTQKDLESIGNEYENYENNENYEDEIVENFPQPAPQNVMYSDANGNLATTTDLGVEYLTVTRDSKISGNSDVSGNSSVKGNLTVSGEVNSGSILANGGANFKPAISINAPVVPESLYSIHFGDGKDVHNRQTGIGYIKGQLNAKFGATRGTLATHIHSDDDYQIITSGWDPIFALKGGSGDAFIKGSLSNGGNMSTSKNLHTKRNRVCFSDTASDPNHSIYNNYTNIDGEGGWDGMKMNTYLGLDVRTKNASGAVPVTRLSVRDNGTLITSESNPASNGFEYRHSNMSQGIGLGYNTIYATGSNADQELNINSRGNLPVKINGVDILDAINKLKARVDDIEPNYIKSGQNVSVQGHNGRLDNYGHRCNQGDSARDVGIACGGGHGSGAHTWKINKI